MPATVHVFFDFAGTDASPGTQQDTNGLGPPNLRFKTDDDATIDTISPMPIVSGETGSSYWKQIYLETTIAPATQIDNIKLYTDGGDFGTGITVNLGDEMPVKNNASDAGYEVATGDAGSAGHDMVANHSGITGETDVFSYTAASPKSVTISETGSILGPVLGSSTNYLVLQMKVAATASAGDLANETFTFQYDEI